MMMMISCSFLLVHTYIRIHNIIDLKPCRIARRGGGVREWGARWSVVRSEMRWTRIKPQKDWVPAQVEEEVGLIKRKIPEVANALVRFDVYASFHHTDSCAMHSVCFCSTYSATHGLSSGLCNLWVFKQPHSGISQTSLLPWNSISSSHSQPLSPCLKTSLKVCAMFANNIISSHSLSLSSSFERRERERRNDDNKVNKHATLCLLCDPG